MRAKHRNDYNHGKDGWVGGNPRYRRGQVRLHPTNDVRTMEDCAVLEEEGHPVPRKDRTMRGLGR